MDQEDRERVLRHYEAIFDAAGPEGEDALIHSMGSPVRQVLAVERELREAQSQGRVLYAEEDIPAPEEEPMTAEPFYGSAYETAYEEAYETEEPAEAREGWENQETPDSWGAAEPPADWGTPEAPEGWAPVETVYAYEEETSDEEEAPPEEPYFREPLEEPEPQTADAPGEDMVFGDYLATEEDSDGWEALPMYGRDLSAIAGVDSIPAAESGADPDWPEEIPSLKEDFPEPEDEDGFPDGTEELAEDSDEDEYLPEESGDDGSEEDDDFEEDPEDGAEPEEDEDAEEDEQEPEEELSAPGPGRIAAAAAVTVPMFVMWVLSFTAIIALGILLLAAGFTACVAGIYLGGYVFGGTIAYMPDLLITCGLALLGLAVALLLIWTGIWIIIAGCGAVVRLSRRIYRGILHGSSATKEEEEDEADD